MIDEKKLIEYLETLTEFERKKSQESAEIGAFDMATCYGHGEYCYKNAINAAEEQPKIGGWIPCSERLPEKKECGNYRGRFLVTVYTNKLTTLYMEYEYTTIRGKEVGRWLWNDRVNIPWEVIAWQALPEAYHGQMD